MRSAWACVPLLAIALCAGHASATELELPAELQWCEDLPTVAGKLGIADTSEAGHAYRADGVYLVTGALWGNAGNHTVIFEEYGDQVALVEVEFRMFRLDSAWAAIVEKLNAGLGAGTSEVVAKASHTPNGETITAQRTRHTYKDPDGAWEVVAHQMSNEIDMVKFIYDRERCRPEPTEEEATDTGASKPAGDVDIFSYDPYADDPLHADTREKELEEEKKKVEEEKAQEEDTTEIDWDDIGSGKKDEEDEEIEW